MFINNRKFKIIFMGGPEANDGYIMKLPDVNKTSGLKNSGLKKQNCLEGTELRDLSFSLEIGSSSYVVFCFTDQTFFVL